MLGARRPSAGKARLDGLPRPLDRSNNVRDVIARSIVRPGSRPCQTAAHGAKQRHAGMHFGAQLVWQLAEVRSHADRCGEAVVRIPLQMIEKVFAIEVFLRHAAVLLVQETKMAVNIDHGRHDGLAGQVDAYGPGRRPDFTLSGDAGEAAVGDDEC